MGEVGHEERGSGEGRPLPPFAWLRFLVPLTCLLASAIPYCRVRGGSAAGGGGRISEERGSTSNGRRINGREESALQQEVSKG